MTAGQGYCYRVRAYNAAGSSGYSNEACGTAATLPSVTLTVGKSGTGTVTSTIPGNAINCGTDCTETVSSGTPITLTATPGAGFVFSGWSGGGCVGTGSCTVPMSTTTTVTATFTTPPPPPPPSGGLIAAYGFAEGSGSTVADVSGNNNTGTISGATWTTAGRFGGALLFNGTNAVVTVPNAVSLQLTTGMTLEAWVYPTVTPTGWRAVIDKNVDRYYLMASSTPNNRPSVGGTWTGGKTNLAAPTALPINTWTHLATTFDGATVRLFVNGTQVASRAEPTPLTSSTATLQIGGNAYSDEFFAGRIDEVRIYNRALTVGEIQSDLANPLGAAPPLPTTVTLTVGKAGAGTGTVTGPGISCGTDCSQALTAGTAVTLTAAPATGSTFTGWSGGGCSGTGPCTVSPTADATVTATFGVQATTVTLTVGKAGAGTGTVTGPGISCGTDCSQALTAGTAVTLTAAPATGSTFTGWSGGGCSGTGPCTVSPTADTTVTATFGVQATTVTLTVSKAGAGTGTVTGPGISCGTDCSQALTAGAPVTLTAAPAPGSTFTGWSGGGCSGTGACTVSPTADITVTATFAAQAPPSGGLVAAYSFDESGGLTVADLSGHGNTGTISGATRTTAGKFGNALVFNGTNAVVTVPNAASLQLTTGMTLEAWVYPTATPTSWRAIIDKNVDGYYLMASSDPNSRPAVGGTWTTGSQNTIAPAGLAVNTWTHLASTYDGVTTRLYVNGVQVASRAQTTPLATTPGTLQIGGDSYPNEYFAGRIDEVRIYNRALSVSEIQAEMNVAVSATVSGSSSSSPSTLAAVTQPATGTEMATGTTAPTANSAPRATTTSQVANPSTLTVVKAGTGTGTVTGPGIGCGNDCSEPIASGTSITLSATAATGSTFTGWTGACGGTGACRVAVSAATVVNATFESSTSPAAVEIIAGAEPGSAPRVRGLTGGGAPTTTDFLAYASSFTGGVFVGLGSLGSPERPLIVTGSGPGIPAEVRAFHADGTSAGASFRPYGTSFRGGVRVAVCDVDGDGIGEIVTVPGPGHNPEVAVWTLGAQRTTRIRRFNAGSTSYTKGLFVACGDVDGDGASEIVVGYDAGAAPEVRVYRVVGGSVAQLNSFLAYDGTFMGGVRVATADIDGDGLVDVITAPGPGAVPEVRAFKVSDSTVSELAAFEAEDPSFTGGVFVAGGRRDGLGGAAVMTSPGPGGTPRVRIFSVSPSAVTESTSVTVGDLGASRGVTLGASP